MFLPRIIEGSLQRAMNLFPVVVITGARRTGKSTLVKNSPRLKSWPYHTLDSAEALAMAEEEPRAFLQQSEVLVVDEVQRSPQLLLTIKELVDRNDSPGRFVLTGSANLLLMSQVAESLAGRARYLTLWPMTRREQLGMGAAGIWGDILGSDVKSWPNIVKDQVAPQEDWRETVMRGGYPRPALYFPKPDQLDDRTELFAAYTQTYLERDLRDLANISSLVDFRKVMRAVCLQIGGFITQAEIARDTGVKRATVQRYLDLLEISYQLIRLEAYTVNRNKRLMKSPKFYWSDTALAMYLAGDFSPRGAHLENMIVMDLLAWKETQSHRPEILYWRTSAGEEVDVLVESRGKLLPIEVKASTNLGYNDARHLRAFLKEYPDEALGGLLLYDGTEIFWISENVLAAPWWMVC